jgi:hypothetical protein
VLLTCGAPNLAAGADYTGELGLSLSLRLTDKGSGASGAEPATVQDLPVPAAIPCTDNADLSTGSTCTLTTSANALLPGSVSAGARAIWQLGQVEIDDGGPDGAASTPDGAAPYAVQGVFVP